jgi:hypothetical protein
MKKLLATPALISIATLWAPGAFADYTCGKACSNYTCSLNAPPTTGSAAGQASA